MSLSRSSHNVPKIKDFSRFNEFGFDEDLQSSVLSQTSREVRQIVKQGRGLFRPIEGSPHDFVDDNLESRSRAGAECVLGGHPRGVKQKGDILVEETPNLVLVKDTPNQSVLTIGETPGLGVRKKLIDLTLSTQVILPIQS